MGRMGTASCSQGIHPPTDLLVQVEVQPLHQRGLARSGHAHEEEHHRLLAEAAAAAVRALARSSRACWSSGRRRRSRGRGSGRCCSVHWPRAHFVGCVHVDCAAVLEWSELASSLACQTLGSLTCMIWYVYVTPCDAVVRVRSRSINITVQHQTTSIPSVDHKLIVLPIYFAHRLVPDNSRA